MITKFAVSVLSLWAHIRGIPGSVQKKIEVCRDQWGDYMTEIQYVILPGIKRAKWYRKPHKTFAFVEEFYDKCPRIAAYLDWVRVPVEVMGILFLLGFSSGAFAKNYPMVYTYQPRDTQPIEGGVVNGVPVQIDEGANWQWKMDAGRLRSQSESDVVIGDRTGNKLFLTECTKTDEICAGQSPTVSFNKQ